MLVYQRVFPMVFLIYGGFSHGFPHGLTMVARHPSLALGEADVASLPGLGFSGSCRAKIHPAIRPSNGI